jgi:hypothetical protein
MATGSVTPAPKESGLEKFENVLTTIAHNMELAQNALINVAVAEQPVLQPLLPAAISGPLFALIDHIQGQLAQIDAQNTAIGASSVPFAEKVAQVVATNGAFYLQSLASAGLTLGAQSMTEFVTGLSVVSKLNFATITQPPAATPPATS